mmetsp:Transcript_33324/g.114660  ORF Transcript_33324/g.114660 Transcript_33324/m.114660 type:complete len:210 (+) Transcript_33324:1725-2354(+)
MAHRQTSTAVISNCASKSADETSDSQTSQSRSHAASPESCVSPQSAVSASGDCGNRFSEPGERRWLCAILQSAETMSSDDPAGPSAASCAVEVTKTPQTMVMTSRLAKVSAANESFRAKTAFAALWMAPAFVEAAGAYAVTVRRADAATQRMAHRASSVEAACRAETPTTSTSTARTSSTTKAFSSASADFDSRAATHLRTKCKPAIKT